MQEPYVVTCNACITQLGEKVKVYQVSDLEGTVLHRTLNQSEAYSFRSSLSEAYHKGREVKEPDHA